MDNKESRPGPDSAAAVEAFIINYSPKLLTRGQISTMLPAIKDAVIATGQPSKLSAGRTLASVCRFVADVAPRSGCELGEVLTDVELARWTGEKKREWGESRTLSNHVGRVRQVLRQQGGLPARILPERRRRVGAPPLSGEQYLALRELCTLGSAPAARAFAAGFGAGRPGGHGAGGRFVEDNGVTVLALPDGSRRRVLDETIGSDLVGQVVDPSDWDALVAVAALRLRVRVEVAVVYQTFRERVFAQGAPAAVAIGVFQLGVEAVDQVVDFLAPVTVAEDVEAQAVLRGPR
jgi:hypothetical protein